MPKLTKRQQHSKALGLQPRTHETDESEDDDENHMEFEDELEDKEPLSFKNRITTNTMADLLELCKAKCPVKHLSTVVYMTLRSFGVNWRSCDAFLQSIGELIYA